MTLTIIDSNGLKTTITHEVLVVSELSLYVLLGVDIIRKVGSLIDPRNNRVLIDTAPTNIIDKPEEQPKITKVELEPTEISKPNPAPKPDPKNEGSTSKGLRS